MLRPHVETCHSTSDEKQQKKKTRIHQKKNCLGLEQELGKPEDPEFAPRRHVFAWRGGCSPVVPHSGSVRFRVGKERVGEGPVGGVVPLCEGIEGGRGGALFPLGEGRGRLLVCLWGGVAVSWGGKGVSQWWRGRGQTPRPS